MAYEGELVRLRAIEPDDLDRYLRWMNDPEVTRTLSMRYPIGREAEREILERMGNRGSYRSVAFAIEVCETGEHIGTVDLGSPYFESRWGTLGLVIGAKEHRGKGYGTDAVRTLCRFAFWEMNLRLVRLTVFPENERARRAYERVGFVLEGTQRQAILKAGEFLDMHMMSITRAEFEAIHGAPPDLRALERLP